MKNKNIDAEQVWKDFEDRLASQLNFSVTDRAVYSHLFRHSRLERKLRFRFSMSWLAGRIRLSEKTTRQSVRRLIARGVLRLVERSCQAHHVVCVRLPQEVRALRAAKTAAHGSARTSRGAAFAETDFLQTQALRRAIHAREGGRCFYCLRRLIPNDGASTTSSRRPASAAIPTATSSPAVSIAIPIKRSATPSSL